MSQSNQLLSKLLTSNAKVRMESKLVKGKPVVCVWGLDLISRVNWHTAGPTLERALQRAVRLSK